MRMSLCGSWEQQAPQLTSWGKTTFVPSLKIRYCYQFTRTRSSANPLLRFETSQRWICPSVLGQTNLAVRNVELSRNLRQALILVWLARMSTGMTIDDLLN
jgi:hypothetical protein